MLNSIQSEDELTLSEYLERSSVYVREIYTLIAPKLREKHQHTNRENSNLSIVRNYHKSSQHATKPSDHLLEPTSMQISRRRNMLLPPFSQTYSSKASKESRILDPTVRKEARKTLFSPQNDNSISHETKEWKKRRLDSTSPHPESKEYDNYEYPNEPNAPLSSNTGQPSTSANDCEYNQRPRMTHSYEKSLPKQKCGEDSATGESKATLSSNAGLPSTSSNDCEYNQRPKTTHSSEKSLPNQTCGEDTATTTEDIKAQLDTFQEKLTIEILQPLKDVCEIQATTSAEVKKLDKKLAIISGLVNSQLRKMPNISNDPNKYDPKR